MKQLYWSRVQEEIHYKGKKYTYTYDTRMIYADNASTSTQEIKDFEDFAARHNLRGFAEEKGKMTLWTDDQDCHTFKKEYFEKVVVTTKIISIPKCYTFSKIMNELNYQDFIDFCKDNGVAVTM